MLNTNDKPADFDRLRPVQSSGLRPVLWKVCALCLVSAVGNTLLTTWVINAAQLPLFLDTLFTVAITMSAGLIPGLGTGVLIYPPVYVLCAIFLRNIPPSTAWASFFFAPCAIIEVALVWIFHGKIKRRSAAPPPAAERRSLTSFFGAAVPLMLLAAADCAAVSVAGGIIDTALFTFPSGPRQDFSPYSVDTLKLGLLRSNMPFLAAAILARIPINIVDRFIVVFGGYGVSILYRKFLGRA
jgi:hypothetical protein